LFFCGNRLLRGLRLGRQTVTNILFLPYHGSPPRADFAPCPPFSEIKVPRPSPPLVSFPFGLFSERLTMPYFSLSFCCFNFFSLPLRLKVTVAFLVCPSSRWIHLMDGRLTSCFPTFSSAFAEGLTRPIFVLPFLVSFLDVMYSISLLFVFDR